MDRIKDVGLSTFLQYKRVCVYTKMKLNVIRNTYSFVDTICKCIEYMARFLVWMIHTYNEPADSAWICMCKYTPSFSTDDASVTPFSTGLRNLVHTTEAKIENEYIRFNKCYLDYWVKPDPTDNTEEPDCRQHPHWKTYKTEYDNACKTSITYDWLGESLIIGKVCPSAVRVRISKNIKPGKDLNEFKPCRFKFIEVEYRCGPNMVVPIEIPRTHYIVGNEILSNAYILRYLKHRLPIYSKCEFNERLYSLCIMGADLKTFTIRGGQYIELKEDGYEIKGTV